LKPENEISHKVVASAVEVHREFGGPWLLESVYAEALVWELSQQGLFVERQVFLPICYKSQNLGNPLRMDLVVENRVVVECKATGQYHKVRRRVSGYGRFTEPGMGSAKCQQQRVGRRHMPRGEEHRKAVFGRTACRV